MAAVLIQPTDRAIKHYYEQLKTADRQGALNEGNVRQAFQTLLSETARVKNWALITEFSDKDVRYDGVLRHETSFLPHGWWEAKDSDDDLDVEIRKKIGRGYILKNTIFENTRQAVLYQDGQEAMRIDLQRPEKLADLLTRFYAYEIKQFEKFHEAVAYFESVIPHMGSGLKSKIETAHRENARFQAAYATFFELCKTSLNPNISRAAVDEMLIQHLMTERLFRKIFDAEEFTRRNVIAVEVEKVIDSLTSHFFNRHEFLGGLDTFYVAIEDAAAALADFSEKQRFLNHVYERFFQGYAVEVADTHGIVYTPQPIADFMCAAVEETLQNEFGYSLGDPRVKILDPCTGTGNFMVNLLRRIGQHSPRDLSTAYRRQLFANEVMLMPYYIASLNIEHAYRELTGQYEPFEGICFVDTLDLKHGIQPELPGMNEENRKRILRQGEAQITVIIGNPPYNVGQLNENDNNKNRTYKGKNGVDTRVRETYAKDSRATNKNALFDPYVKFFRWATDRLAGREGIVCFVSNNSFADQFAFDGMRKHLLQDFTCVYHLDLHGNVRKNPKLSGTTHNVFGIQVGVGITVAVHSGKHTERKLFYHRVPEFWRKEEKLAYLDKNVELAGRHNALNTIEWEELTPDNRHNWLILEHTDEFTSFMPMGSKAGDAIFKNHSPGLQTNRDIWVYDFDRIRLAEKCRRMIDFYNAEIDRWKRSKKPKDIDNFVVADEAKIKWSSSLKQSFARERYAEYSELEIRNSLYRPFTRQYVFFDSVLNHRPGIAPQIFPTPVTEQENVLISLSGVGHDFFTCLASNHIVDLACPNIGHGVNQCFPFYVYDPDSTNRRENITDWALAQFRAHYADDSISKWDIFYYVYGLLHHPGYREKYADNLKRDLPRIPFAPDFWSFSKAGKQLADLHLNYETVEPYRLNWRTGDKPISYRVEKMKLNKDKTALVVNDTLTLEGIPPETFAYRLGNRSALDWVIDQYQVTTDKRSGITSDPNQADEPEYIVRLVERVVKVSVETVKIVAALPQIQAGSEIESK